MGDLQGVVELGELERRHLQRARELIHFGGLLGPGVAGDSLRDGEIADEGLRLLGGRQGATAQLHERRRRSRLAARREREGGREQREHVVGCRGLMITRLQHFPLQK